jgi:hypothetical protein
LSTTEPPIKATLESAEFTTDVTPGIRTRLLSCLHSDLHHILPKYRGGTDGKEVEYIHFQVGLHDQVLAYRDDELPGPD